MDVHDVLLHDRLNGLRTIRHSSLLYSIDCNRLRCLNFTDHLIVLVSLHSGIYSSFPINDFAEWEVGCIGQSVRRICKEKNNLEYSRKVILTIFFVVLKEMRVEYNFRDKCNVENNKIPSGDGFPYFEDIDA